MTSQDIKRGCALTLQIAHRLREQMAPRVPSGVEIQWQVATAYEERFPSITRLAAMKLAAQMMAVVRTAEEFSNQLGDQPDGKAKSKRKIKNKSPGSNRE